VNPEAGGTSAEVDAAELQRRLQTALGDGFAVEGPLGEGGFAIVFAVFDRTLSRRIAVKVLRPELSASRASKQRFVREAESVARLNHPHILPIFFVGEHQGLAWFGMPLVDGESLDAKLRREGRLTEPEVARIGMEIAEALADAHAAGLVHRDIKPLNVMLQGARQRVLVADFGIAKAAVASGEDKITGTGIAIGSPQYMSPEQASGDEHVDHRSDIYSLGILLWQMLAGDVPFASGGSQAVLMQQVNRDVPPIHSRRPGLSPALAAVVTRCVEKPRDARYQSAEEVAAALRVLSFGGGASGESRTVRWWTRPWVAAAALVFGFGLFGGVYWLVNSTERAAARAAETGPTVTAAPAAPATTAPAIAVLPFATVGAGDTAQFGRSAALMLGEALALRNGVTTVDGNSLLSRWITDRRTITAPLDSSARFAYGLGANQMVIGNYVGSGNSFRLSVALYDTHDAQRLWTGETTGSTDSLFTLLDRLATRVAEALCAQPDYNPGSICFDTPARPRAPLAIRAGTVSVPIGFFAHVSARGEVDDVRIARNSGDESLTPQALALLQGAAFTPARHAGRAVAAWTTVDIGVEAGSEVALATTCEDAEFGVKNPDGACYDTRPAPRTAPVLSAPTTCRAAPTPVALRVRVTAGGTVEGVPAVTAPSDCDAFTAAAAAAASRIAFVPAWKSGRAVSAWTQILVQPLRATGGR
jgi:TolB-like protein/tRNA A-37 threonylcarbamoyl transferase component Bud32